MFKRKLKSVSNAVKSVRLEDLSAGVQPKLFAVDELARYGLSSRASAVAYDPVQGLMAIVTHENELHVYGQQCVEVVLPLASSALIDYIEFVKGVYLIAVDQKGNMLVISLLQKKLLYSILSPGKPTAIECDPSLDWLLIGMSNGTVLVFDIDRGSMTKFGIENLQREVLPKERLSEVVSIQWNPRDIGTVLIAYNQCAVVYSLAQGIVKTSFRYDVPPGAPGGYGSISTLARSPKLIGALYHPNSLNAVTFHDDGSLVFWDALTGTMILARTLEDVDVNLPTNSRVPSSQKLPTKIDQIRWITAEDPDDTTLLILTGNGSSLTGLHFGLAPKYSLTSYEKMNHYYSRPKQTFVLPVNHQSTVEHILPVATTTPYFKGCHNPQYLLIFLDSGEVQTIDFPHRKMTSRSALFPQSLAWIHSKTTFSCATSVPKKKWLGMISATHSRNFILTGGMSMKQTHLSNTEMRSALITGHSNGFVRLSDVSFSDVGATTILEIDVPHALGLEMQVPVDKVSYSGENGELAVSLYSGDVALFKFEVNRLYDPRKGDALADMIGRISLNSTGLVDLRAHSPNIKEGFMPVCALMSTGTRGEITALNNSNVGFVALAYQNGDVVIIDRRGPAIIFDENVAKFSGNNRSHNLISLEFAIMAYGDDNYSSILLFGGSDKGELYIYKVLPESSGKFTGQLVDVIDTNDFGISNIVPYKAETGTPLVATMENFNTLADGLIIQGALMLGSSRDIRIVVPGKGKSTHKIFSSDILACGVSVIPTKNMTKPYSSVFPVLSINNSVKVLSNPELKEIATVQLPFQIVPQWGKFSSVLPTGQLLIRKSETEAESISIIGPGHLFGELVPDKIFSERLKIPHRPTVGTAQWIKGTALIGHDDLDELIGGNKRPPPKHEQESEFSKTALSKPPAVIPTSASSNSDEYSYNRPVRKRQMGGYDPSRSIIHSIQNTYDSVEESINDYATNAQQSMNEAIGAAKKDLVKSVFKSKFGI